MIQIEFDREALIEARKRAGLTFDQLAKRMNVSRQWVCQLEKNENMPNIRTLLKFIDALGIDDVNSVFKIRDPEREAILFRKFIL